MKNTLLLYLFLSISLGLIAQKKEPKNVASFELGSGMNFSFNEGAYQFNFGGFIQPFYGFSQTQDSDPDHFFTARNTFLLLSGKAVKEKVSFSIQADYSRNQPLLDAWVAYHPTKNTVITFGQKQTFVNNREMIYREDRLQFTNRSLLSQTMSNTGREFGVFAETKLGTDFGIVPMLAVTSGDGRNSFGSDSRDTDFGGLKIGGRLDVYPLGYFSEGNDLHSADLGREQKLKLVVGAAISQNYGATNVVGEGHGNFFLYDSIGGLQLPNYTQLYVDILVKYKGFSFLGEFANASAQLTDKSYLDAGAATILVPTQISQYLMLGDRMNFQLGYVTKSGFSFDARYEIASPEFSANLNSILSESNALTFGVSKYFDNNNLKIQTSVTSIDFANNKNQLLGELLMQIVF